MKVRAAGRRQLLGERAVVAISGVEVAVEDGGRAAETLVGHHGLGYDELQPRARAAHDGCRLISQGHYLDRGRLHVRLVHREPFDPVVITFKIGLEGEGLSIALSGRDTDADARRRLAVVGDRLDELQRTRLAQDVEQLVDAAIVAVAPGQGDGPQVLRVSEVGGVKPQALRIVVEGGIVQVGHRPHGADAAVDHLATHTALLIDEGLARHGRGNNGVRI